MTSRFRSTWAKEGPKSTSPTFDRSPNRAHAIGDDYRNEYYEKDSLGGNITKQRDGSRIIRDRSIEKRNGKSRDRNNGGGGSSYEDERKLDESESSDRSYYRKYKDDFRWRSSEIEKSSRERRWTKEGMKKGASGVGASDTRYDLDEDEPDDDDDVGSLQPRLASSTITNGSSSMRVASNGSTRQINQIEQRRDQATTGSLTRERPGFKDLDVTNRSSIPLNDRPNGSHREKPTKRSNRNTKNQELYGSNENNDCASIDRSRMRHRDHSYSPIDDVTNRHGHTSTRRSEIKRKQSRDTDRSYSHGRLGEDGEDFGSMDRRMRRHAEGRSYSPEEDDDGVTNGISNRSERREKCMIDQELGSMPRRSTRGHVEENAIFQDNGDELVGKTNGNRSDNVNGRKYRDFDNEDIQHRKEISKKNSNSHHQASPEDFDVQIHRYERALRAPRRDSDLTRKSSFKDYDSDLSRKSSFEDHQNRKISHRRRDAEIVRRGSCEDRDREQVSRKSSVKNRDPDRSRKSSLTNNVNNGSHHRDSSEPRKDREPSITRRRSSRSNDEDHDRSSCKNDRHSRPLTPPMINELSHKNYQSKTHDETEVESPTRDRFSSLSRRVVSSRSFNESRHQDNSLRNSRIDGGCQSTPRDILEDEDDPRGDLRDLGFSTIERNGTTVIRIRTNSESPMGQVDNNRRRGSYRAYEDEAEDEDEDDKSFEHDVRRMQDSPRREYKIGSRRLWSGRDRVRNKQHPKISVELKVSSFIVKRFLLF